MQAAGKLRTVLVAVVAVPLLASSIFLLVVGLRSLWTAHESRSWPTVKGTIVQSVVAKSGSGSKVKYSPVIEYRYEVDGRTAQGSRLRAAPTGSDDTPDREEVESILKLYPQGSEVTVHYDPERPDRALLRPGDTTGAMYYLMMGGWVFLVSLYMLVRAMRGRWPRRMARLPALNLQFRRPRGFTMARGGANGPADLVLRSGDVSLFVHGGLSSGFVFSTPDAVAGRRISYIERNSDGHQLLRRESVEHEGLPGVLLELAVREGSADTCQVSFCLGWRGFTYELILVGPEKALGDGKGVARMRELIPHLTIPDRDTSAWARFAPFESKWESADHGCSFTPGADGWRQWTNLAGEFEAAAFGLFHAKGGVMTIIPLTLPAGELPFEGVCCALLRLYGIHYGDSSLVTIGGDDGAQSPWRSWSFRRRLGENEYEYRLHAVRWERVVCLSTVSTEPDNPHLDPLFREVVEGLEPPAEEFVPTGVEGLDSRGKRRHAVAWEGLAQWHKDSSHFAPAAEAYQRVLDLQPDNEDALRGLLHCHTFRGRYAEALEILERHLPRFRGNLSIRSFEPFLLKRLSRPDEAAAEFEKLIEAGWRDRADLNDYVELLIEQRRFDDARERIASWLASNEDPWLRRLLARAHREAGDHGAAIAELRSVADRDRSDLETQVALAHEYSHAKRFNEALQVCEAMEERGQLNASVHFARGIAENGLEWHRKAQRSFEAALKDSPGNDQFRSWLDHVTGQLGQGSTRLIRNPIGALDLPLDGPVDPTGRFEDADAIHLDLTQVARFQRGRELRLTCRHRVLARTALGAERWSTFRISFDPEREELFVNEVRIRDARGEIVAIATLEDCFVKDRASDDGEAAKVVHIPLPGLTAGGTLEVTYTRRSSGSLGTFPFRRFRLGREQPVLRSLLEVRGDLDGLAHRTAGEVASQRTERTLRFSAEEITGAVREPYAVDACRWRPTVWLAGTGESWEEVVREYLDLIAERLEPKQRLVELAKELTRDARTDEERAAAIAAYVRREIAYKAILFGPRAYVPEWADRVLDSRFGDCKAHANLFLHLMRAAGLRCHLALVNTGDDLWPEAPTRSQFNHMINYCPDLGGGRFVDCVDKGLSITVESPNGLGGGRTALVLDADAPRCLTITAYADQGNVVALERRVSCRSDGSLEVEETISLTGNLAAYMRNWLKGIGEAERVQRLEGLLRKLDAKLELSSVELPGLDDIDGAMRLVMAYQIRGALERADNRLVGRLPALWERDYLLPERLARRVGPFEVELPICTRSTVVVSANNGLVIETSEAAQADDADDFRRFERTIRSVQNALEMEHRCDQSKGHHEPGRYPDFVDSMQRAVDAAAIRVVLSPESPP